MALTSSIDSLKQNDEIYSVTSSLDGSTPSKVTGDRTTGLFADAAKKEGMGKDDFLKLLTTQLQYQDPLAPEDNTQMVAQLAQFSALEASQNSATAIDKLGKSFKDSLNIQNSSAISMTNASSVSLIGKRVRLKQQSFEYLGRGDATFKVNMGAKDKVVVEIFDKDKNTVKEYTVTNKDEKNTGTFTWDGKDEHGMPVPAGNYAIYIEGQENDPALYSFVEDTVQGVRYDASGPVIKVAGQELPIGNVIGVDTASSDSKSGDFNMTMGQALTLIGKNIKYKDSGTTFAPVLGGNKTYNIDFAGTSTATIVVRDGQGNVARTYKITDDGTGMKKVTIPMDDINGTGGRYSVSIENNPNAFFYKDGEVSGVTNTSYGYDIKIGGKVINPSDILEVNS